MLTVEKKFQSGGKLLPHSDLRISGGECFWGKHCAEYEDGSAGGGLWVCGLDWASPG